MHNLRHLNSNDIISRDSLGERVENNNIPKESLIPKINVLALQQIKTNKIQIHFAERDLQNIGSDINLNLSPLNDAKLSPKKNSSSKVKNLSQNMEALRVLVVEDDIPSQKVIYLMLKELGYKNIDLVESGRDAIEVFSRNKYDLVILDIGLPDIDGLHASKQMRESSTNDKTAIIALTAFGREEIEQKCYASGINDVITKPVFIDELKNVLESWMNIKT